MTPEERAEKISRKAYDLFIGNEYTLLNEFIVDQIREAVAIAEEETRVNLHYGQINLARVGGKLEGKAEGYEEGRNDAIKEFKAVREMAYDEAFSHGFKKGLEDAAKIIEGFTILDPIGAAVAIRARAEETK